MSYGILDLYFNKNEQEVLLEYNILYSSGKINSYDSDLRMVLIMNSLKTSPSTFTSIEIAIMNIITNLRINNVNFNFITIFPILKNGLTLNFEDQRIVNLESIDRNINLGLIPSNVRLDSSPPIKNHKTINYASPDFINCLENGIDSENVYCEWNKC